jgi:hypothetical protein
LWAEMVIAIRSDTPARTTLRTAILRKSWKMQHRGNTV